MEWIARSPLGVRRRGLQELEGNQSESRLTGCGHTCSVAGPQEGQVPRGDGCWYSFGG